MLAAGANTRAAFTALLLTAAVAPMVSAQGTDSVAVVVRVVDSAGVPVAGADVALRTRTSSIVARAQTDKDGRAALSVPRNGPVAEVFVRHVGFQPFTHALSTPLDGSVTIAVVLADLAYALDTVAVNSRESLRRRMYYIDSMTIARSSRAVYDGWDLLRKLRPDIAYGRDPVNYCPGVQNVFVNGQWIVPETVVINDMVAAREPQSNGAVTPHLAARGQPRGFGRIAAMSIMAMIKPEHIAEMTYRDCRDKEIAGPHSKNALFVILAPGIGFDPGKGTFAIKP